jgi:hypothetical protein
MYCPVPIKRSTKYGSNYWEGYSPKAKRLVRFFSDLEYDHWVLIEMNPDIIDFCEQPMRIKLQFDGKMTESIIDMWLKYRNGQEYFIEVKYMKDLDEKNPKSARSLKQIEVQKRWCIENGHYHKVQTEQDIRHNTIKLENMRQMIPYIRNITISNELDCTRILNAIESGNKTICDIESSLMSLTENRVRESIYWLLFKGKICADVDKFPLSRKTEVWINIE